MQGANSEGKASPGQPFIAPKAEIWNGMIDAGNAFRVGRLSVDAPDRTKPRQTDVIKLKNTSGANRAAGQILRINGKAVTDLSSESIWLTGTAPTASSFFGILKEPIANSSVGAVQISGCCLAKIDVVDAGHTRAEARDDEYTLKSSDEGPIEILYKPSGTGELECVVRFGDSSQCAIFFTPSGGIPARSGTTLGQASCTKVKLDGFALTTLTGQTSAVGNLSTEAVGGSKYIQALRISGTWVANWEQCE